MHSIILLALKLDCHNTIVVLVVESKGSLTIALVSQVVRIINDLPEINGVKCFSL